MRLSCQRRRVVALLVIMIFLPIIINIYFIYFRTLEVVKKEKISVSESVLRKTTETMEFKFSGISKSVSEFTGSLAVGASISKYKEVAVIFQEKIDNHISEKLNEVVDNNFYIDDAICYTKEGKIYTAKDLVKFNESLLLEGLKYKENQAFDSEDVFFITDVETNHGTLEKGIFLFRSIYHVPPNNTKISTDNTSVNEDAYKEVGYVFIYINKDKLIDIYSNSNGSTVLGKDNEIAIYDKGFAPVIGSVSIDMTPSLFKDFVSNDTRLVMKEQVINNEKMVLGISLVESAQWHIVSLVPVDSLIESTQAGLKETLLILGLIGIIVALIIFLQTLEFSDTIIQKEIVDYRLTVSEEVNEKLRLYKHDFMNHLQIIQGLLQMDCPERAIEYLKNVAKEGRNINTNYEVGIPELEVTLNTIINKAKEQNIDVEVEVSEITNELPLSNNELIKIIMNLANNAIFALVDSEEDHKLLKIKIKNDLGNYTFEVCNNTPIIPKAIRKEIFKKGFSTKGNRGNGLGLYIIKKALKKCEGTIELVVDEQGNHFIVTIPDIKELSTVKG